METRSKRRKATTSTPAENTQATAEEVKPDAKADRFVTQGRGLDRLSYKNESKWTGNFWFAQLADTQLGFLESNASWEQEVKMTTLAVEHINRLRPRFVIVCGDLVHAFPNEQALQVQQAIAYKEVMSKVSPDIPLLCVCGNHDVGNIPTRESIQTFTDRFGADYYTFWVGGVKGFVLNTSLIDDPSGAPDLAAEQWKWLARELEACAHEKPTHVLAFGHISPFLFDVDEPDDYFNIDKDTRYRLLNALRDVGCKFMFCGHYHRNAVGRYGDFEVVTTGAVGVQLVTKEGMSPLGLGVEVPIPGIGPEVSGFRAVRVTKNTVTHKWHTFNDLKAVKNFSRL